jgi:enediyne biosynthesis protein E4
MGAIVSSSKESCMPWMAVFILLVPYLARTDAGVGGMQIRLENIALQSGISHKTTFGDESRNRYLLETTGSGIAFLDYDGDGWLDIFQVNGTRLETADGEDLPTNRLYRNLGNGQFQDVSRTAGVEHSGWGQSVCVGDYNNDGHEDIFVTYYGRNLLYRNNGDGTFTEVAEAVGVAHNKTRWGSGAAFLDYDRDGHLDLFVASYIDLDLETAPLPETGPCLYKGVLVACGPPGLPGGVNALFRNNGDGTFTDVSEESRVTETAGTYGLGVLVGDFNNDGWPDIYVANDSAPAALYLNNQDGTFTDVAIEAGCAFSIDGKPQAGMGVSAGDFDRDGWLDIFKTNFSGDTSTLYRNATGIQGETAFEDVTFPAGIGVNTRFLGWGCGFVDMNNNGWLDIFLVNGHVYPEVEKLTTEAGYAQRKILYQNLGDGSFKDVSDQVGGAVIEPSPARGCAFGDFDNDGDIDVVVNNVNHYPELIRNHSDPSNNWIKIRTIGSKSNRSGIGARLVLTTADGVRIDEVRSGGSYYSQNDLRVHFGLGKQSEVEALEVRWPSGQVDRFTEVPVNRILVAREGAAELESVFPAGQASDR